MSILITGGAGYIGSNAALELLLQDYPVIIVDNLCSSTMKSIDTLRNLNKQLTFYNVDLCNNTELNKVFDKHDIISVIHFASLKVLSDSINNPLHYYENNIMSTISLLKCMEIHNVHNIIFSSSATVYGKPDTNPISETADIRPTNPYGFTKSMIEQILIDTCKVNKINVVILRYFNPAGVHNSGIVTEHVVKPDNIFPYIKKVLHNELPKFYVYGDDYNTIDGTGVRDYIHIQDLVDVHIESMKHLDTQTEFNICKIYNVGTGKGSSVLQVLYNLQQSIPFEIIGRREGDSDELVADTTKVYKELGWKSKKNLKDICKDQDYIQL